MSLIVTLLALAAPAGDYKPYVPPAPSETSTPLFVIIAYSAIWLVLMFFVVSIWMRQRRVDEEIRALQRRLES
jgi:CcmD family protein